MAETRVFAEAQCGRCGETFVPHDECCRSWCFCRGPKTIWVEPEHCAVHCLTLVHGVREDGEECGGQGVILGHWTAPSIEKK